MNAKHRCRRCHALFSKATARCPHCGEAVTGGDGIAVACAPLVLETPQGERIAVAPGEVVGRSAVGRELLEPYEGVSRRHVQFSCAGERWFVTDLKSSNGTYLAGQRLVPELPTPVAHGQVLALSPLFEATLVLTTAQQPAEGAEDTLLSAETAAADAAKRPTLVVFFADIKGSVDYFQEMGTMVAKNWIFKLFQMLNDIIAQHQGQHLKNIGDAILAVFTDPGEAAQAAKEMQSAILEYNKNAPENERYYLRIGMNIGRVLFEHNDVFGNAVNIASRVQDLTPPGRIYVTRNFTDHIRAKFDLRVRFIRQEQLKGVRHPIDIFELMNETAAEAKVPPRS